LAAADPIDLYGRLRAGRTPVAEDAARACAAGLPRAAVGSGAAVLAGRTASACTAASAGGTAASTRRAAATGGTVLATPGSRAAAAGAARRNLARRVDVTAAPGGAQTERD